MVNRNYTKEVGLDSNTPMLPRAASYGILAVVGAVIAFGIVRVAAEAPTHAPTKAATASATAGQH